MFQKTQILLLTAITLLVVQTINAQDFKTQSVSIFKNGQSFFFKSGNVKPDNGFYKLNEKDVPPALFGSLWFHEPNGGINIIKSYPDTIENKKTRLAVMFHELLEINEGKKLKIYLKGDKSIQGLLEEYISKQQNNGNALPYTTRMVIMKSDTDDNWASFYVNQINHIEFLEKPNLNFEQLDKSPKNIVEVKFGNNKSNQTLDMMYLRDGLNWAPEYLLELKSDTKADLTLQAEILNNGEDLENVDVNLVVGVPNFKFGDKPSFLIDFMKKRGHSFTGGAQQVRLSNAVSFNPNTYEMEAPVSTTTASIEGSENEDYFFYGLNDFSLPKGGRAMQKIFKENIDIAHVYEVNLPERNNRTTFNEDFFFSPDNKNKVFHTIRVNNTTGRPWTTGSVFIINNEGERKPVSQDMLAYTSHGGHSFIKVTEATDIKIRHAEKEIGRTENAKRYPKNSYHYDLVNVEGKIKIRNFKNEEIHLNVRRPITGELKETNVPWLKQGAQSISGNPNKKDNICWEMKLKAGEEIEVVYTYDVYIRS